MSWPVPPVALTLSAALPVRASAQDLPGLSREVAEGSAKAVRHGDVIALSGSESAEKFARLAQRCEIVQKLPSARRRVGTPCLISGQGCG